MFAKKPPTQPPETIILPPCLRQVDGKRRAQKDQGIWIKASFLGEHGGGGKSARLLPPPGILKDRCFYPQFSCHPPSPNQPDCVGGIAALSTGETTSSMDELGWNPTCTMKLLLPPTPPLAISFTMSPCEWDQDGGLREVTTPGNDYIWIPTRYFWISVTNIGGGEGAPISNRSWRDLFKHPKYSILFFSFRGCLGMLWGQL